MLSQREIEQYHENGFLIVHQVFDPAFLERMRTTVTSLVERSRRVDSHDEVYDLEPGHCAERPRVRRIKQPHQVDPVFLEAIKHPRLLAIVQQLLGPSGVRLRTSKLNLKEAGYGAPVEWHQDWAFYPHTNQDVLAVGVMLDDCQMENGPLQVIPGSHKGPIFDHHADGVFCGAIDPAAAQLDFSQAVACTAPAGSIEIHHARMVHGSADNTSSKPRRLLLFELTAVDAWPLLGFADMEAYDRNILVGEPTLTPRLENVPVRLPLPPAIRQGSIYENQTALKNRFFGAGETVRSVS